MSDTSCLIGHTGFVGSIMARQTSFSHLFNSSNIDEIGDGPEFDVVVCAAAPGSMLEANRQPDLDLARIEALIDRLRNVRARRFVLISSIAVLADFAAGYDEGTGAFQTELAYGRHRRALEVFCADRFENCLIMRLPALFGPGLRKNFIFDLLNPMPSMLPAARLDTLVSAVGPRRGEQLARLYGPDAASQMLKLDRHSFDAHPERLTLERVVTEAGFSATTFHHPETTYQYYDMTRLWADLGHATEAGLAEAHLATEPLQVARIHERLLGQLMPESGAKLHREDMHTRHADVWGRTGPYLDDAGNILDRLAAFFAAQRVPA
jgi:hypothetical protein